MRKFLLMTGFLLLSNFLFAQGKSDSLHRVYHDATADTIRIRTLFELGNLYIDGPSDSLIYYYDRALKMIDSFQPVKGSTQEIGVMKKLRYRALLELGIENFFQGNYHRSLDFYDEALDIAMELKDINLESEVYGAMGIVYKNQGKYRDALENYEKALKLAIELNDSSWIAACYVNSANVYRRLTNYTKALDYLQKALSVFEKGNEKRRMAIANMNIGNLYEDQKDYDVAMQYYQVALDLSKETEDNKRIAECYMNFGNIYSAKGNYLEARSFFLKTIEINESLGFNHILDDCYLEVGLTLEKEKKWDEAKNYFEKSLAMAVTENDKYIISNTFLALSKVSFEESKFQQAADFALTGLEVSTEIGEPMNMLTAYEYLSLAYEELNQPGKALFYQKWVAAYKDTVFNSEKYKALNDLQMKYETEKKEQQLQLLEEQAMVKDLQLGKRNRLVWTLAALVVLLLVLAYLALYNIRLKNKHASILLEQKLLRSQMNPHFIFNALIAIQSFIYKKEAVIAGDYLAKFAELVRITLDNSRTEMVLLQREIKMLELYLELQALRFDDKFDFTISVDPRIDTERIKVPPMIAQPFVENAIEHGLRFKKEKGKIQIRFQCFDQVMIFSVEDDGIGRQKAHEVEANKKHHSMATSITKDRLKVLGRKFRNSFDLEITDLTDENQKPAGTRATLMIPYIKT